MSLLELFLLAVGLSMDAFAVSVCKGLSVRRGSMKQALTVGIWFGGFQALISRLSSGHHVFLSDHEHRPLDRLRPAGIYRFQHDPRSQKR